MKVLIIGLGSIAKKHINALLKINPNCTIYALRSSKTASNYLNVINVFDIADVKTIELDFIIISSPTSLHLNDINRCLIFKRPLLIEKPAFDTLEIGDLLIKAALTPNYIGCNLRFLESIAFVKDFVTKNSSLKVNEVNVYFGSYLPDWRPGTNFKEGYSADDTRGGGVHLDLIHEIDYLVWIFGLPNQSTKKLRSTSHLNINAADYANFVLEYDQFTASVVLNYYRRDVKREFEIVFDQCTIKVDLNKNLVTKNGEVIFNSEQTILDTYTKQMKYFIENKSGKMFNDLNEAFETLKICLKNE